MKPPTLKQRQKHDRDGGRRAAQLMGLGQSVVVTRDDGSEFHTNTTSEPWQLGHGAWVIKVAGISGGYDILRVSPLPPETGTEAKP